MSLPRVGAAYDDYRTLNQKRTVCLTGTRTALLEAIGHWAVARDEKPIYLLTGHAGYGKSTIVRTVSERLDNLHILGASFFFSRDDNQSKSTSHFFSTLAYQLCVFSEAFAQAIGNALKSLKTLDAVEKSPASQLMYLVVGPLKRFNMSSRNIVIVVDALDECEDFKSSEGESWGRDIWDGLATLVEELPFVRVFLTSRPHQHLSTLIANNPRLYINNTSVEASDPDIKRYLKCKLIKEAFYPLGRYHVTESQISHLARMAAGLFIIAATAVRFIMDPRAISPSERIKALIEGSMSGPTSPNKLVDRMYETVLNQSLALENPSEREQFQAIVGTIIHFNTQLRLVELAEFLGLELSVLRYVIDKLQAIITLTNDKPQFHKSFVDYITDRARSGDQHIPRSLVEAVIAFNCFRTLGALSRPNASPQSLQQQWIIYATRHLPSHCSAADRAVLKRLSRDAYLQHPGFWTDVATCLILRSLPYFSEDHLWNIQKSMVLLCLRI